MKKRGRLILWFLGIVSVIMLWNGRILFRDQIGSDCWEGSTHTYSKDVLFSGVVYEFRGEFDLNTFRKQCRYYLERTTGDTVIAETPREAAELGQFHFDLLGDSAILVYYCPKTDNWVIEREHFDYRFFLGRRPTDLFAINRSDGSVVEFSRNRENFIIEKLEGWRRTVGIQRYYELALMTILGKSIMLLLSPYTVTFVSSFKKIR